MRPRVEARTTEVDCRRIAELLDAQVAAPKPIEPDLEADIEIGTSSTTTTSPRTPSRLAHTLRRAGAELARGSQPIAITVAVVEQPPIVALALPLPAPPANATLTAPMPVLMATNLNSDSMLIPDLTPQMTPARSRIWWLVGIAAFVVSGLALLEALRA